MASPLAELLGDLAAALDGLAVGWYLFGAQAAIVHGAARLTADVDVTVLLPAALSPGMLVDALRQCHFEPRFGAPQFLAQTRVIPLEHSSTRMPLDIVLGGPGLEEAFVARARRQHVESAEVPVASAEDLVVMKILAGRPKDIEDVAAVLAAQHHSFDITYARQTLATLEEALGQSDLVPVVERLWAETSDA
jgi:hypothetical protein